MNRIMKTLFETVTLGNLKLKNRFVRSGTLLIGDADNGIISSRLHHTHQVLAEGDVGLIITGMISVMEQGSANFSMVRADLPEFIFELSKTTDIVHRYGCKIIAQLCHCGLKSHSIHQIPYGPNAIHDGRGILREEMRLVRKSFANAARKCKAAGVDGVQIHSAHGYLISEFLSPYFNYRKDEYGGSLQNRSRFLLEIYEEMRNCVGDDFPIWVKINSTDLTTPGLTLEESIWICQELEHRKVDAVEISGGISVSPESQAALPVHSVFEEGYFSDNALQIANCVRIPVISVGGYRTRSVMERVLNAGNVEAISICRPLIRNPSFLKTLL